MEQLLEKLLRALADQASLEELAQAKAAHNTSRLLLRVTPEYTQSLQLMASWTPDKHEYLDLHEREQLVRIYSADGQAENLYCSSTCLFIKDNSNIEPRDQ